MKIALAQTRPIRGNIPANVSAHVRMIELAAERSAEFIVFPELSLSGYEPRLACDLAVDVQDPRFEVFQKLSDRHGMTIAVGVPTRATPRPRITLLGFAPGGPRTSYSKQYLHPDEDPYFSPGIPSVGLMGVGLKIAPAICYELSVPAHARAAFAAGAGLYLCSVAKTASGVEKAQGRLAEIAREQGAPVLMANCVGPSGDGECAGASAAWNRKGERVGQLDPAHEGLLGFDSATEQATA